MTSRTYLKPACPLHVSVQPLLPSDMDALPTLPYTASQHFATDPMMDPPDLSEPVVDPRKRKMKRASQYLADDPMMNPSTNACRPTPRKRKLAVRKDEVTTSSYFGVTKLATYADLDKGLVFNCLETFQNEFNIDSYCVGAGNDRVLCYIKFKKAVDYDVVLGLMLTASKNSEYAINPLSSKTKQKNMLCSIYKQDKMPLERLNVEERHLVPFTLLLPSWLAKYVDKQLDLSDPFLLAYASNFPYLSALVSSQSAKREKEEEEEEEEKEEEDSENE